ncbi:MAG: response regulator [Pelagimonas sp.]|uniref:response regulator n=1 Tax=Pelagimonas sp. TaxID=2073170 RepID=UPI003D6C5FED
MSEIQIGDIQPRILVADDEPINVKVLQKLLKHCGLSCEVARDGLECIEKAETGHYDVILMDINMPNMDGVAATKQISQMLAPEGPKVIAVTANVSNAQRAECDGAGFSGFIPKPVRLDTLKEVLASNLN